MRSAYGRLFARLYDRVLAAQEEAGFTEMRRALVGDASGHVLEIGAGTGLNMPHYTDSVERLVLAEPEAPMARQLHERAEATPLMTDVVAAPGESLPFGEDEFDVVVATLVLCTTDDPSQTVAEIARVLKPGGRFLFMEHVRSDDPGVARWQDRLHGPWKLIGHGCHCNRDTAGTIHASELEVEEIIEDRIPKAPAIVRPLIRGSATLPG